MNTSSVGRAAEDAVAQYLKQQGFKILVQNWKTRWCEIDVVVKKNNSVHFVEVKFRKNAKYGSGLEYITAAKAKQLQKAALFWVSDNNWTGDYQIDGAGVDGETDTVEYIENIIGY